MRCKQCQYSLKGLTDNRCPECGCAFDPDDPSTLFHPNDPIGVPRWHTAVLLLVAYGAGFALMGADFELWQNFAGSTISDWLLAAIASVIPAIVLFSLLLVPYFLVRELRDEGD